MKKAGLITIALVLVAAGVVVYCWLQGSGQKIPIDKGQGTLVKEYIEWKRYYM